MSTPYDIMYHAVIDWSIMWSIQQPSISLYSDKPVTTTDVRWSVLKENRWWPPTVFLHVQQPILISKIFLWLTYTANKLLLYFIPRYRYKPIDNFQIISESMQCERITIAIAGVITHVSRAIRSNHFHVTDPKFISFRWNESI